MVDYVVDLCLVYEVNVFEYWDVWEIGEVGID